MKAHEAAALDAIRAAYGEEVAYTGAGLDGETVTAIFSDAAAMSFQGAGESLREVTFEIDKSELPQPPRNGNVIVQGSQRWSVINIVSRLDVEVWVLTVEEAPAP